MRHERHAGHAGSTLRILRDANGLTLGEAVEVIQAAGRKCSRSYLSQVENGKRTPSMRYVADVSAILARRLNDTVTAA